MSNTSNGSGNGPRISDASIHARSDLPRATAIRWAAMMQRTVTAKAKSMKINMGVKCHRRTKNARALTEAGNAR